KGATSMVAIRDLVASEVRDALEDSAANDVAGRAEVEQVRRAARLQRTKEAKSSVGQGAKASERSAVIRERETAPNSGNAQRKARKRLSARSSRQGDTGASRVCTDNEFAQAAAVFHARVRRELGGRKGRGKKVKN